MQLPVVSTDRCIPNIPSGFIGRVDKDENTVLLPRVFELLLGMPGAQEKRVGSCKAVLYNGVLVVDTHANAYLDGGAPDITIIPTGFIVAAFVALALLELQVGSLNSK